MASFFKRISAVLILFCRASSILFCLALLCDTHMRAVHPCYEGGRGEHVRRISYSYTMVLGIYGSKPTKPEGKVVYVAINP